MPLYTRRTLQFPNNQVLLPDNTLPMGSGSITESAFPSFDLPDPNNPSGPPAHYVFLFWSLTDQIVSAQTYTTPVPSASFTHTQWYYRTGVGNGDPHVTAWAYSHAQGIITGDNPIDSVTPASAWSGGQSVATMGGAVTIDAKNSIGGEDFQAWTIFGQGTASGDDVSAPQNANAWAIASYLVGERVPVDPGIFKIRETLVNVMANLIDLKSDPAPIDLMRMRETLSDVEASPQKAKADPATGILERVDAMDKGELRKTALDLKARITRLAEAAKAVDEALGGRGK